MNINLDPQQWRKSFMPDTKWGERRNLSNLLKAQGFNGSIIAQNILNPKDKTFSDGDSFLFSNNNRNLVLYNVKNGDSLSKIIQNYNKKLPQGAEKLTEEALLSINPHLSIEKGKGLKDTDFIILPGSSLSTRGEINEEKPVSSPVPKRKVTPPKTQPRSKFGTNVKNKEPRDMKGLYPSWLDTLSEKDFIKYFEGFRAKIYNDNGHPAIGYGHRIVKSIKEDLIAAGAEGDLAEVPASGEITKAQAELLLASDLKKAKEQARRIFGNNFDKLSSEQQEILAELIYNQGPGFKKDELKAAIEKGDFKAVQAQLCYTLATKKDSKTGKEYKVRDAGLIKRSLARMIKWGGGKLNPEAEKVIMHACEQYCLQNGENTPRTFEEALKIIIKW